MTAQRKPAKPKHKGAAAAVGLAQKLLQDEQVRAALLKAPKALVEWAARQRSTWKPSSRKPAADRFGQKGLERRLSSLTDAAVLAFPDTESDERKELDRALQSLKQALAVAGHLPLLKRKRAHHRIDTELDDLERAMVDAVLPK